MMRLELPTGLFTYPDVELPPVWMVEQTNAARGADLSEVADEVLRAVRALWETAGLPLGASVAIGLGSRGIRNLAAIAATAVDAIRELGAVPFIVPAMGSHGGATADGQEAILRDYGILPDVVRAPVHATMNVKELGRLEGTDSGEFAGHSVWCDENAARADGILLINRIKPHTDFGGPVESGIAKMLAIGLGKRHGAEAIHRHGAYGLRELMPRVARHMAAALPVLGGIAILENQAGETAEVHALRATDIGRAGEAALLERARKMCPHLPFDKIDVLVVDEMGKNISGTGMDTHVIGRALMPSIPEADWDGPLVRMIAVLSLSRDSHGNASGLGLADVTTRALLESVDFNATLTNTRTSGEGGILKSRIPVPLESADDCVRTAMGSCGRGDMRRVRLVRIRNTNCTRWMEVSAALLDEARANSALRVSPESRTLDLNRLLPQHA
ncbi:MAG: DUF2088 domain-containing protein [Armatimonadetes bacterium]|nr:DUF2088 domain-containing protein [Armatimonadota bacterium]MDE2207671.1 DUF2088 domain-containing protein [Armatimonadota bacterium]